MYASPRATPRAIRSRASRLRCSGDDDPNRPAEQMQQNHPVIALWSNFATTQATKDSSFSNLLDL
jgi:hypothetical protein